MAPQREWFEKDYYKVLGVPETARRRRTSPRRTASWPASSTPTPTPATPTAEERFKEVSAAYDVVGDEAKRKEYDEVRKLGPMGAHVRAGRRRRPRAAPRASRSPSTPATSATCSANLFGRGGRRRGGGAARGAGPQRGDRPRGRAAPVVRRRRQRRHHDAAPHLATRPCSTCHGIGRRAGHHAAHVCPTCGGRGVHRRQPGPLLVQPALPHLPRHAACVIDDPCPTCRGTGVERRPREVKVRIPAGVDDGQRIRLKGRGGPVATAARRRPLRRGAASSPHPLFGARRRQPHPAPCRSPSPRPRSAPTSRCPRSTAARSRIRVPAGTQPGTHVPGQGPRRRRPRRARATCSSPSRSPCPPTLDRRRARGGRGAAPQADRLAARTWRCRDMAEP